MRVLRAIAAVLIVTLAAYNLLTIPFLDDPVILLDVSQLTYNGTQVWLVESERVDRSTTRYGVSTSRGGAQETEFWVNDHEIEGRLNYFYTWDTFRRTGRSLREDVILNGVIWTATVLVFGFILSYRDRDTYLIATKIAGLVSAIGVFGLLSTEMPFRSAIVSFVPSAGWGIVLPMAGILLDRTLGMNEIDLSFMDILEGLIDEIVFAMLGYTFLEIISIFYPIADYLPW
jgi:hypothetical protein